MATWRILLTLALAAFVLARNLPGALLFLWPGWMRVRPRPDDAPEIDADLRAAMEKELEPLGFRLAGVHAEHAPLRRAALHYDFQHEAEPTLAIALPRGGQAHLDLVTAFEGGGFVRTADYKRPGTEREGLLLSGGMPGASPEQLLAVHRRRVERMVQAGRSPLPAGGSGEERAALARAWYRGPGARETRLAHLDQFLLTLACLIVAALVVTALRGSSGFLGPAGTPGLPG